MAEIPVPRRRFADSETVSETTDFRVYLLLCCFLCPWLRGPGKLLCTLDLDELMVSSFSSSFRNRMSNISLHGSCSRFYSYYSFSAVSLQSTKRSGWWYVSSYFRWSIWLVVHIPLRDLVRISVFHIQVNKDLATGRYRLLEPLPLLDSVRCAQYHLISSMWDMGCMGRIRIRPRSKTS